MRQNVDSFNLHVYTSRHSRSYTSKPTDWTVLNLQLLKRSSGTSQMGHGYPPPPPRARLEKPAERSDDRKGLDHQVQQDCHAETTQSKASPKGPTEYNYPLKPAEAKDEKRPARSRPSPGAPSRGRPQRPAAAAAPARTPERGWQAGCPGRLLPSSAAVGFPSQLS